MYSLTIRRRLSTVLRLCASSTPWRFATQPAKTAYDSLADLQFWDSLTVKLRF